MKKFNLNDYRILHKSEVWTLSPKKIKEGVHVCEWLMIDKKTGNYSVLKPLYKNWSKRKRSFMTYDKKEIIGNPMKLEVIRTFPLSHLKERTYK